MFIDSRQADPAPPTKLGFSLSLLTPRLAIAIGASILLLTLFCCWMVSYGTWHLRAEESRGRFYDAQARSLLSGRIDVSEYDIEIEAFVRNGKYYGYFGPTPAFLRIPLNALFPSMYGKWSRISIAAAYLLSLLCVAGFYLAAVAALELDFKASKLGPFAAILLLWGVGMGSTLIFISSRAFVYHEAAIWAGAMALLSYSCLVLYLFRPTTPRVVLLCLFAYLAFFARISGGVGPALSCALLAVALAIQWLGPRLSLAQRLAWVPEKLGVGKDLRAGRHCGLLAGFLLLLTLSHAGINYWKFGLLWNAHPVEMKLLYMPDPARMANVKAGLFSVSNLRFTVFNYFLARDLSIRNEFPFVAMVQPSIIEERLRFPEAHIDMIEPFASLPLSSPGLVLVAAVGVAGIFLAPRKKLRIFRLPCLCACAGGAAILTWGALAQRYLHDFFPLLAIAAPAGIAIWQAEGNVILKRALGTVFTILFAYSIAANLQITFDYQRRIVWGVDQAPRRAYANFVREFNAKLHGKPAPAAQDPK
jgi:hypothetical protein